MLFAEQSNRLRHDRHRHSRMPSYRPGCQHWTCIILSTRRTDHIIRAPDLSDQRREFAQYIPRILLQDTQLTLNTIPDIALSYPHSLDD